MTDKPISAIVVGAGHRSYIYATFSKKRPDMLKIVGVADPDPVRRKSIMDLCGFGEDMCFSSAEELASHGKLADAIINGTMDEMHLGTSLPLLNLGYDMLLEKPFAVSEQEAIELYECSKRNNVKVVICLVLRYSPFYIDIKNKISSGEIGDIISINTTEAVSYHHMSVAFVRGKWANSNRCHTSMLLAKCSHDIDLICWMMNPVEPQCVSSFGGRYLFVPENAPKDAGSICMSDCPHVDSCPYSTKLLYIDHPSRWQAYVWSALEHIKNPTLEDKIALMKSDSPYARCIYKCDNNVVDRQSVAINFKSGAVASHLMIGGASKSERSIDIYGTKGEIHGLLDSGKYTLLKIDPSKDAVGGDHSITEIDVNGDIDSGHGGGDFKLVEDFVNYIRDGKKSISTAALEDCMIGHLAVFRADKSRENGGMPENLTDIFDRKK